MWSQLPALLPLLLSLPATALQGPWLTLPSSGVVVWCSLASASADGFLPWEAWVLRTGEVISRLQP
jgi:hypothetical protein